MQPVTCDYCGLPFKVRRVEPGRPVFCCAGCALANRIPRGSGEFPVTPELVTALVAGFAAFNQVLWWMLAGLIEQEGRVELAVRLSWVSISVGGVAWGVIQWANHRAGARRALDLVVAVGTFLLIATGVVAHSPACAVVGSLGALAWVARGWFRAAKTKD